MWKVLVVCTGNICRSPTAEGVLRARAEARGLGQLLVLDSAGTHDYHTGEPPDARTIRAAAARGYDLSLLRARTVHRRDFERFDLLLGMATTHVQSLLQLAPASLRKKVARFDEEDVEDPYYGNADGFERVLDHIERRSDLLLDEWFPGKG